MTENTKPDLTPLGSLIFCCFLILSGLGLTVMAGFGVWDIVVRGHFPHDAPFLIAESLFVFFGALIAAAPFLCAEAE